VFVTLAAIFLAPNVAVQVTIVLVVPVAADSF